MNNTAINTETVMEKIVFPPVKTVRLGDAELDKLRQEGIAFRRDIERRSASMFAIRQSNASMKMR